MKPITIVQPGSFEAENHWYPKALNATIHPLVAFFLNLSTERIVQRYCHLHPMVQASDLTEILSYRPRTFFWAGADLFNVTSATGKRSMAVIENNSCPSGQKSMPLVDDYQEMGGYRRLMESTFAQVIRGRRLPKGELAVIYDKNHMEASGYAAAMADVFQEPVNFIPFYQDELGEQLRSTEGILEFKRGEEWVPIRAAFRYLTQKPWNRLPVNSKTFIFNPILACLAGGRNKAVASKAYDFYNGDLRDTGLKITMPETIRDVGKHEVPLWVSRMGGHAVVKNPYSNAGQGVYTIVNETDLDEFMALESEYGLFIVQSLIGNYNWSSTTSAGRLYHVGTMPNKRGATYVADLRMMIHATNEGLKPLSIYSRRARKPLVDHLSPEESSWDILGTNLSLKLDANSWSSDTNRLLLMDRKDFNQIGVGLDDLIEAFIQTVLSTIAIDKMAVNLLNSKGRFRTKLFKSLNNDPQLIDEILIQ